MKSPKNQLKNKIETQDEILKRLNLEIVEDLKSYNGNEMLKRVGQKIDYTPDMIREYQKCANSLLYFVEHYMKIINPDEGMVLFKLYGYQKKILKAYEQNRFVVLNMARQSGKSTTTCAFILWFILFNKEKTVAMLANKESVAIEMLGKIKLAYQYLPKWLQQGIIEWNKTMIELENNTRVFATATAPDAARGYTVNFLFVDEAAHIEQWEAFSSSVLPTIAASKTSKVVLVSTPNGMNHFYKTYNEAVNKKNSYFPLKVTWQEVPGRDEKWRQDALSLLNFDQDKFNQEYEGEFLGSSGTLIGGWKLKELTVMDPIPKIEHQGLAQYYKPIKGHLYSIVCDVARGKGIDYSAFQVIDVSTMPYKQVAVYRSNSISPYDYAEVIHRIAKSYNNAIVLVEINDIGDMVAHTLQYDMSYENILYTSSIGQGKTVSMGFGLSGKKSDKGVRTTIQIKNVGCSLLKLLIEQNQLIINDFHTIEELSTFSKKNNTYKAEPTKHDDLVMCLVLFAWLTDTSYFKEYSNINTLKSLRDKSDEDMEQDMAPFGFIEDGRDILTQDYFMVNERIIQHNQDSWLWIDDSEEPPTNF